MDIKTQRILYLRDKISEYEECIEEYKNELLKLYETVDVPYQGE